MESEAERPGVTSLHNLAFRRGVKRNTVQESGSHPFVVPPSGGICTGYHNRIRLKAGLQANIERYWGETIHNPEWRSGKGLQKMRQENNETKLSEKRRQELENFLRPLEFPKSEAERDRMFREVVRMVDDHRQD